ncbi:hypothetical protein HJFPF1_12536 [Paramyrothecium foliicola]|nr:hypothetical protein HJFPF1_12536 [Paramyrothecium foliicola]
MSSQTTRTGRRGGIPLNLVNNWQCPGKRNQQVLVRRPITACEPCRAAKVKCDGQYDCGRCTSRGMDCKYAPSAKAATAHPTQSNASSSPPVEMPIRLDDSAVESPVMEMAIDKPSDTNSTEWAKDLGYSSPELFDWNSLDLGMIINSADLIWITAVFQQTGSCFEYISNINFGHYVKVGVGEYEILMPNESSLGRILVMDLVKQADALLMALASLGQTMTVTNTVPNPLTQVNLEYIQEVIKSFRLIFQRIENKD